MQVSQSYQLALASVANLKTFYSLEQLVRNRWASLPLKERASKSAPSSSAGIRAHLALADVRTFVASAISLAAADEDAIQANRVLVRKLDAVLIEVRVEAASRRSLFIG